MSILLSDASTGPALITVRALLDDVYKDDLTGPVADALRAHLGQPGTRAILATVNDDRPAGCILMTRKDSGGTLLHSLAVGIDYRRMGVASKLIASAVETVRAAHSTDLISAHVAEDSIWMPRRFETFGFIRVPDQMVHGGVVLICRDTLLLPDQRDAA